MEEHKQTTLGMLEVTDDTDFYVVVDFLNRTLKDRDLVFGLTKAEEAGALQITVYEETGTAH